MEFDEEMYLGKKDLHARVFTVTINEELG